MYRMILFVISILFSLSICAQNDGKTITLGDITVKGAKVVNKVDGMTIYPTEVQKNASHDGYSILQKLSLPNLRIDDTDHTVTVIDNRGGIQLRVNGIVVGKHEMLALDPKQISKIEFIDNPSLRYDGDTAYVINIITRNTDSGYTIGVDLTPALTTWKGEGTLYGKWHTGKSGLSVSYDFNGYKLEGGRMTQVADYTLNDGSVYSIERADIETLKKAYQHDVKLTYNLVDTTAYIFQASLSESLGKTPCDYSVKEIMDGTNCYLATDKESEESHMPVLDLYFFRQYTPRQSVTTNVVGTYILTDANNFYDERTPYQYDVNGKTASVWSEFIYENRLKPFILSTGLNYHYKYTQNDYQGDALALIDMNQHMGYAFSEIKGRLHALRYSLGAGVSYINYRQREHHYNLWTFRPKTTIDYTLGKGIQLRYSYQMQDRNSRIAMTSDATIQINCMEQTVGNPDLKPSRDTEHTLRMSYNTSRWQTFLQGYYKQCRNPNMAFYQRTADNKFLYMQMNQPEIDLLHIMAYADWWLIPNKLQVATYGGMQRCFNEGVDYTHCYTSWFYVGNITTYLGNFTMQAYTDNGHRWLEGETKGFNGGQTSLKISYRHKDCQVSLTWTNPFVHSYKSSEGELVNRDLHKLTTAYTTDMGNQVTFQVLWRLNRGKKHQDIEKTIHLQDTDNGIIVK